MKHEDEKYCPLSGKVCDEHCAWWNGYHDGCVVFTILDAVNDLWADLGAKRELRGKEF